LEATMYVLWYAKCAREEIGDAWYDLCTIKPVNR